MYEIEIPFEVGHGLEAYTAEIEQIVMQYMVKVYDRPYTDEEKAALEEHNYAQFSGVSVNDDRVRIHVIHINPDETDELTRILIEAVRDYYASLV